MGRVEEAENIVRKIAKFNKVEAPLAIFDNYNSEVSVFQLDDGDTFFRGNIRPAYKLIEIHPQQSDNKTLTSLLPIIT